MPFGWSAALQTLQTLQTKISANDFLGRGKKCDCCHLKGLSVKVTQGM